MAIEAENSVEYAKAYVDKTGALEPHEQHGRVRCAYFVHDQVATGDAGSSIAAVKLPAGKVRLLGRQSSVYVNWTTASATLDVGWDAYTDIDGTAVAADPNGLDDGKDVETAGYVTLCALLTATGGTKVFESQDGVTIRFTSQDTANVIGDDLVGTIFYVID